MSEARAKGPVAASIPETQRVPGAPAAEQRDPFGSIAHLGELPSDRTGGPGDATAGPASDPPPRASQPPPSTQRSHVRIKACVVEEVVAPARKDYRRE